MKQSASTVMMVRPVSFQYNVQTAQSNEFQNQVQNISATEILTKAQSEFDTMVGELQAVGVHVVVIEDSVEPIKPDAIFPNNWISMSQEGNLTIFPMKNQNRQWEKRSDIVHKIEEEYIVKSKIDLSEYEHQDRALEGTGSIVYDHINRTAYACLSPRTDSEIFESYCKQIHYKPVVFHSHDSKGKLIYHTNVVMCVGSGYVVIGMDTITDPNERIMLEDEFKLADLEVVNLSNDQLLSSFAGNMLQVCNQDGENYLVMSKLAYSSLTDKQKHQIESYTNILPVSIDIIETIGGGSARCMMAEIFLDKK